MATTDPTMHRGDHHRPPRCLWRTASLLAAVTTVLGTAGAALLSGAPAGAAMPASVWNGNGVHPDWSVSTNWTGAAPTAGGSVPTLVFPDLTGAGCAPVPPSSTSSCYQSTDDESTLSAQAIDFAASTGSYDITSASPSNTVTLGSGGITLSSPPSGQAFNQFGVPLHLGADQTWGLTGPSQLTVASVNGPTSDSLDATLGNQAVLAFESDAETGPFTATAGSSGGGLVALDGGGAELNGADGSPVKVNGVALAGQGVVGPLSAVSATVEPGFETQHPGSLTVTGAASFDAGSSLSMSISGSGSAGVTTPGTDNSELVATGAVNLGGAHLLVSTGYPGATPTCVNPPINTTYTLVSAAGGLTGQVSGPGGSVVPDGGSIPLGAVGGCSTPAKSLQLAYGTHTLTGTVVSGAATPPPSGTQLLAAPGATATGPCTSTPCSLAGAIALAEQTTGAVTVQLQGGTYHHQVTVDPPASSPMTALTLLGPPSGSAAPAVIEPTSLAQNVTEGDTGNFFDDNTGKTAAIVGVQTGSTDAAAGATGHPAKSPAVTVENVTVSGIDLGGLPPGGELEGIAMIDTSGSVVGNTVENLEQSGYMGQAAVHGIEVKATNTPATVSVTGNTAVHDAGHVDVDLMSSGGDLSATVTGNTLTGDPVANVTDVAQFGVAAADLGSLTVSGNTITKFQSPWSVGAVWLDPQAPKAPCQVTDNTLTANDNGVDLHGASGCTVSGNTITAGAAGVEIGPDYAGAGAPSNGDTISANTITGTTTEATTHAYDGSSTPIPTASGMPTDGVLVWDGSSDAVQGNAVSGFDSDVYVGEDPLYLNNTPTWPSGLPASYSGYTVSGVTATDDSLTAPAVPAVGSGYGAVAGNVPGGATSPPALTATDDWWGSASGPSSPSNTYDVASQGAAIAGPVPFAPWLTGAPALGATGVTGFAPVTDTTQHTVFPSIQAAVDAASTGDTIDVAAGVFSEGVTVTKSLTLQGAQAGVPGVDAGISQTVVSGAGSGAKGSSGFGVEADGVTIDGFTISDPNGATGGPGYGFGVDVPSSVSGTRVVDDRITDNVAGIYLNSDGTAPSVVQDDLISDNNLTGSASGDGVYSDAGLSNAQIEGDVFGGIGANGGGVVLAGTQSGVTVQGDDFQGTGTAVVLFGTSDSSVIDNTVTTGGTGNDGVLVGGGDSGITVEGNDITQVSGYAVNVEDYVSANSGVTVRYNAFGAADTAGGLDVGSGAMSGGTKVTATDDWWGCSGGPTGGKGCASATGSATSAPYLSTMTLSPAKQAVAAGTSAAVTATLQDSAGATVDAPLSVQFTTTPTVGHAMVRLSAGTAAFEVSSAHAATVAVDAAVAFGAAPETSSLTGSASVTFAPVVVTLGSGPGTTPPPPPAPAGATSSTTGTSDSPTGTASATLGGTTVTGSGEGSFTVAQYPGDPAGAPTFTSAGRYLDVKVASGSSFSSLTVTDCALNGGTSLEWWTGSAWQAVSPESYAAGPPACVTATLGASSSPSIAQLTGTVLAVVAPATSKGSGSGSGTGSGSGSGPGGVTRAGSGAQGYWEVASDGGVFSFGGAGFYGSMGGKALDKPVVGLAATPDGAGYWEVASDGGVFAFGDAGFSGSLPGLPAADQPASPVVALVPTPDGKGYWEVTASGDVYSFGDAAFAGSLGTTHLDAPVAGMATTPDGKGYWLVGRDGGVFAFGDAAYLGNAVGTVSGTGGSPVVAMAATADGKGYWLVSADGAVAAFGDAGSLGSPASLTLAKPVVGVAATADGEGYWLAGGDGGVFAYGDAAYAGSEGGQPLNAPVVGIAAG